MAHSICADANVHALISRAEGEARLSDVELRTDLIDEAADIGNVTAAWDQLAAAARLPLMSAAQVAAWWTHLAPKDAAPRIVLVWAGHRLIGVAPFYERRRNGDMLRRYALPGSEIGAGISLLSHPGRQWEVAVAVAAALVALPSPPDMIDFRRAPIASPWPTMLRASWPAAILPRIAQRNVVLVPGIALGKQAFEEWFQGKSANFRSQLRRAMRSFEREGGRVRVSNATNIEQDAAAMMSLHIKRMGRDRSSLAPVADQVVGAIADAGAHEAADGHLRLWVLEIEGTVISVQWFSARGGHVSYLNGGWDPSFRRYSPALLGIVSAIKDACERGDDYMDLGPGVHGYKMRLADRTDAVARTTLIMANRRVVTTTAQVVPELLRDSVRDAAKRVLPPRQRDALIALRRVALGTRMKSARR